MSATQRRVIVNADDLGRTDGINEGIFQAHRQGVVTSATLMVNYPASSSAAADLAHHPELGIGLHVALTGDDPCLPADSVPSLVDENGRLAAKPELFGELVAAEVQAEVFAQLERFQELTGCQPTHLDSHHHSHRHPVVLEAVIDAARKVGCSVRSSGDAVRERLYAAEMSTTEAFDERFFAEDATTAVLLSILDDCVDGTTEIMCHPGCVDEVLRTSSSYTDDRERELEILCSEEVFEAFAERDLVRETFAGLLSRGVQSV